MFIIGLSLRNLNLNLQIGRKAAPQTSLTPTLQHMSEHISWIIEHDKTKISHSKTSTRSERPLAGYGCPLVNFINWNCDVG